MWSAIFIRTKFWDSKKKTLCFLFFISGWRKKYAHRRVMDGGWGINFVPSLFCACWWFFWSTILSVQNFFSTNICLLLKFCRRIIFDEHSSKQTISYIKICWWFFLISYFFNEQSLFLVGFLQNAKSIFFPMFKNTSVLFRFVILYTPKSVFMIWKKRRTHIAYYAKYVTTHTPTQIRSHNLKRAFENPFGQGSWSSRGFFEYPLSWQRLRALQRFFTKDKIKCVRKLHKTKKRTFKKVKNESFSKKGSGCEKGLINSKAWSFK